MKLKLTLTALLILLLMSILLLRQQQEPPAQPDKISGAYEALNFLSMQRLYPHERLPERAHFAAWERLQQSVAGRSAPPSAPWESMGPHNIGGRTLAIAFNPQNPNTMYLGSASGGLWRSYTAGAGALAWERVETGFPVLAVSSIAFAPGDSSVMYLGTGEVYNINLAGTGAAYRSTRGSYGIGVLKSTDGGRSWEKSLDWSYEQQHGVWAVKVAPSDPDIVYSATTQGVFKSSDAGANWSQVHNVVMATDLLIHPDDPDLVVAGCGNFSSAGFGLYRTANGGETWNKTTTGVPAQFNGKIQLGMAPGSPNVIYASFGNGFSQNDGASWLCRSSNFGSGWSIRTQTDYSQYQGWFAHDVAVSPINSNELAVVGINVWKSSNGGNSLSITAGNGEVHPDCHDVTYHPTDPNVVFVATDGGLYRSDDGGNQYFPVNSGYQTVQFYNGFSNSAQDSTVAFGGLQDNGSISWNADESLSWTQVFGGDGGWSAVDQNDDSRVFVSWQGLNIQRSVNGGGFQSIAPPGNEFTVFIAPYVIAQDNADIIYAGRTNIYKSENAGDNWAVTGDGNGLDGNPILSMAISPENSDVVYAATAPIPGNTTHGVFVTTNGGASWNNITTPNLPDRFPMDMTVDPTNEATAYITYSGFGSGHLYRTTDYGDSWEDLSEGLPDVPTNAVVVDPVFPDFIYVGNDLGVFVSTDGGSAWHLFQDGLPGTTMVFDLVISPANRKLRVATHGNGAYQRDLLEEELPIGTDEVIINVLARSTRVFPNPMRERAALQYELEQKGQVMVQLLDGTGRVIRNLANEVQPEGVHELVLNRQGLSNGMYFLRLQAGGTQVTKKLVMR